MAEKVLGTDGLEHIKEQFVKKPAGVSAETLNKYTNHPDAASQLYYKPHDTMATLYPNTYKTMTELPADLDTSKIENADDFFSGMAALKHIDKADFPLATSAERIFKGCTSLESIGSINLPLARSLSEAFENCEKLTTVPEFDTSRCANFFCVFLNCKSLPETFPWTIDMLNVPNNWADRNGGKMMFEGTPVTTVNIKATYLCYCGAAPELFKYSTAEMKLYDGTGTLKGTYTPDGSDTYVHNSIPSSGINSCLESGTKIWGTNYSGHDDLRGNYAPDFTEKIYGNSYQTALHYGLLLENNFLSKTMDAAGTVTVDSGLLDASLSLTSTCKKGRFVYDNNYEYDVWTERTVASSTPYTVTLDASYFDSRPNLTALQSLVSARIAQYMKPSSQWEHTYTKSVDESKTAGTSTTTSTNSDDGLTTTTVTTDGRTTETLVRTINTGTLTMKVITAKDDKNHTLTVGEKSCLYYKPSLTVNIVDA